MIRSLKICGISDLETLNYIVDHPYPPKFIGFITNYEKSKRNVKYDVLKKITDINRKEIKFVSVLVNPSDEILDKIQDLNFDYYQLYDVNPKRTLEIKKKYKVKIISAITITNKKDVEKYKDYKDFSEIILFDGKGYEKSVSFDHQLVNDLPASLNKMIAGNIKIEDIPNFKNKDFIIDLSGALEDKNGKKDITKIDKLLNLINKT